MRRFATNSRCAFECLHGAAPVVINADGNGTVGGSEYTITNGTKIFFISNGGGGSNAGEIIILEK
jgi:hypothetical protein